MTKHLSKEDKELIRKFANRPRYKRSPEELVPVEDED